MVPEAEGGAGEEEEEEEEEGVAMVVELVGEHAISRWSEALGMPGVSRSEAGSRDMRCVRGNLPPNLDSDDKGVYGARDFSSSSAMQRVLLPAERTTGSADGLGGQRARLLGEEQVGAAAAVGRRLVKGQQLTLTETICLVVCPSVVSEWGVSVFCWHVSWMER